MVDSQYSLEKVASQSTGVVASQPAPQNLEAITFSEALPFLLVSLLERRYLSDFRPENWRLSKQETGQHYPLLREITGLGHPDNAEEWARAMPHVLTACHESGQALVMMLHGQGNRHRLYIGGRRMGTMAARSTEDYLDVQESAFKTYFSGLQMGPLTKLADEDLAEMMQLLQTAPTLTAITGIPSGRDGSLSLMFQSLDRLARATVQHRYVLQVVAEPLEPWVIDEALDICRRLKSEIHAYIRRIVSRTQGETEGVTHTEAEQGNTLAANMPIALFGLAAFCQVAGFFVPALGPMLSALSGSSQEMAFMANSRAMRDSAAHSKQKSSGKTWTEAGTMELLNANAEACELLLQRHIERLQAGRSTGWWRTAVYIAAEDEAAAHAVSGALRSLGSGDTSALDPLRTLFLPAYSLREAVTHGWVLDMHPAEGQQPHPLGRSFDTLGTCLTSEELAVLVNLPQQELPGIPMRTLSNFALSVPPPTEDVLLLGTLIDGMGHGLEPLTVTPAALNRHVFVTGLTGSGKTNTCMQLLLEAYQTHGVPFLVLEPAKAEYRQLKRIRTVAQNLHIYSVGNNSPLPFRLNPLSPVPGIPLARHIDLLKAVFNASFPMFAGMPYVLEEALLEIYAERGWSLFTSQNTLLTPRSGLDERSALTPSLQDLHDKIEVVLARKRYAQEIHQNMGAALRSRLHSLMVGNKGMMLNTQRSTPLEDLLRSPTIIELQNLGDDEEKAFLMAVLFVLLYEYAEVRQQDLPLNRRNTLQHITLVEEAHRLLQAKHGVNNAETGDPRAKAVTMFADMLAEMRAYGEGFIIADQIPTKLTPEILKNSNIKIIHRLVAPDDRLAAGSCINLTEQQMRHLTTLAPGVAVVHDERIGEAVLARIQQVKDLAGDGETLTAQPAVSINDKSYLLRHAGCRSCPAPCQFYYHWEEASNQDELARSFQPCLDSILLDNIEQVWQSWRQWLEGWLYNTGMVDTNPQQMTGATYCIVTQVAYGWLADQLNVRAQSSQKGSLLTPADRLRRERAARALGKLFICWLPKTLLDEEARTQFNTARQELQTAIAERPPRELPGCQQCPARCRVLAWVAPHVAKLEKTVQTSEQLAPDARLEIIKRAAQQSIPLLSRYSTGSSTGKAILYCILTNSRGANSYPNGDDALLTMLRKDIQEP